MGDIFYEREAYCKTTGRWTIAFRFEIIENSFLIINSDEIEKLAKERKVKALVLDSTTPNVPGNNLYKTFGFDWELDAYKRRQSFFGARAFFMACNSSVIKFYKEI